MTESSSPERLEAANSNNKPSKKSPMSSAAFLQQFVHEYVDTRPAAVKNELIEEAMTKDTLSGTKVATGLAEFRASDEKYNDVNISETGEGAIDIAMVRRYLAKGYVQTKKAKQDLQSKVLNEYDIEATEYQTKVIPGLKNKSYEDLQRFLRSEQKLVVFLKKQLGRDPQTRVKFDILAGVSVKQMQEKFRRLPEKKPEEKKQKEELKDILTKLQQGQIPNDFDIRAIVESSLLDETQKIRFVHQFIPVITLQQALDIELILEGEAEQIRLNYIRDAIADKELSPENATKVLELLTLKDIQVTTRDLVTTSDHAVKISKGVGFEDFVSDLEYQKQVMLENLRSSGPKSFEGLKASLAQLGERKCQYTMLFDRGNILQVTKMQSGGEKDVHYVRIGDYDDEKKEFTYQKLGGPQINLKNRTEYDTIRYEDFFANVSKDSATSFIALTPETVQLKIQSKEIISTELQSYVPEDLAGDDKAQKRKEIQAQEIQALQDELAQEKEKASKDASSDAAARVKTLENELKKAQETEYDLDTLSYLANKFSLLEKINELDPEGTSLGLKRGVAFQIGKGENANTYTIDGFDPDTEEIRFHSRAGSESIKFGNFLTGFQEKKAKRVKSITSEGELVAGFGENFELKDGEVIQKDAELNGEKKDRTVEYMSDGKHKLVKIVSLSGGYVEFQEGEIHDAEDHGHGKNDGHGHGHGKEEKKYSLKIEEGKPQRWTLDEFHRYITEEELKADWKLGQSYEEHPQEAKNPTHGSFVNKFMKGISLYELMHGGQMVVEGITEALHNGSHAKSAHAALAMAKWLPGELRDEMRMKVEAAEAEETEGAKKKLGAIDSWMAAKRIDEWLQNRDTPQYKLEAAALYMMEKYGHLTSKDALYKYRGKFMWYERLGGRVGDELYNEMKKRAENEGQTFSEEKLIHFLFKKQCDERKHHYSGIHRRSRVHKEFENAWKNGVNGEAEKGEKDADSFRSSTTMANEGFGEIVTGTTTNGLRGWAHRVATKGTANNVKDYMLIPASILLSGACFDVDQTTYTKVKSFWDEGLPITAFRMFGNVGLMNLFRDTVKDLSSEIQKAYPDKFPNIENDVKSLLRLDRDTDEKERLNNAKEVWNKYGEVLTRALHMNLSSDVNNEKDFSKTDSIIKRKRDTNSNFAKYYKVVSDAVGEGQAFHEDYVDDWVGDTGFMGLNVNEITKKYLQLDQGGGFRRGSAAEKVWEQIKNDINATPNKILEGSTVDDSGNRTEQKKYLVEILQELISGYLSLHGGNESALRALSRDTSSVGSQLKSWGIDVIGDLQSYSPEDMLTGKGGAGKYIEQIAENIISGKGKNTASIDIPDIFKKTKQAAYQATTQNPANMNSIYMN